METQKEVANTVKRKLTGTVVSDKGNKTVVVQVTRKFKHPRYSKFVSQRKKYHAHDENNTFKTGDIVTIVEARPFSRLKRWLVINK